MPPLILPSTTSGTALAVLRHRLADELGFYQAVAVSDTPTNADAARVVLSDELRDDEAGVGHMAARWLYVATGTQQGTQRRILRQPDAGYQGPVGAVMLSRPLDSTLTEGDQVEVTNPLPVKRHTGVKGLNDIINEALALIWIEARLSLTGNGGYEYDLSAYPWLRIYEQMRGIYDTRWLPGGSPSELSSYGYRLVTNGATRTLITEQSYTTADTFEVAVIIKADRLVSDGTDWFYADDLAPGLQDDAWETPAPERWVLAFAMVKALQYLTRLLMADQRMDKQERAAALADIMERRQTWARAAAEIKLKEFPTPLPERTQPMVSVGVAPRWA